MRVVCINNERLLERAPDSLLTIGKIYNTLDFDHEGLFRVMDNSGTERSYMKDRFKPLEEIRQEKLEQLGI